MSSLDNAQKIRTNDSFTAKADKQEGPQAFNITENFGELIGASTTFNVIIASTAEQIDADTVAFLASDNTHYQLNRADFEKHYGPKPTGNPNTLYFLTEPKIALSEDSKRDIASRLSLMKNSDPQVAKILSDTHEQRGQNIGARHDVGLNHI